MTTRRTGLALGAAGLAAGIGLGVTGFAHAADPAVTPSPSQGQQAQPRGPGHGPRPFGRFRADHAPRYGGLVTAIDSDSLTVRTPRGTQTVGLDGSTAYYVGKTKATRSAIDKGSVVHVRLVDPRASKKVAAVVSVVPARLDGWVTKMDSDTITVTDPSGFTRVVQTGSSTKYVKDGAASSRSAITVGTFVRAVGSVADDGTTLVADRVATGRPAKMARPGGGGMDGAPPAFDPSDDGPDGAPGAPDDGPVA